MIAALLLAAGAALAQLGAPSMAEHASAAQQRMFVHAGAMRIAACSAMLGGELPPHAGFSDAELAAKVEAMSRDGKTAALRARACVRALRARGAGLPEGARVLPRVVLSLGCTVAARKRTVVPEHACAGVPLRWDIDT